jgi:hypothetical protein
MCQSSPLARWSCSLLLLALGITMVSWMPSFIDQQVHQGVNQYINITSPSEREPPSWIRFEALARLHLLKADGFHRPLAC